MSSGDSKKTWEVLLPVRQGQSLDDGSVSNEDKYQFVSLNDEEAWKNFFEMQNDPSTNTTNTKRSNPHIRVESKGMFKYTAVDGNKYNGKYIIGKVADEIKEELFKYLGDGVSKSIELKESKQQREGGIIMSSARIILSSNNTKPINTSNLLNIAVCQKYGIGAVTFCLPNNYKTRGLRYQIIDGVRVYEVCNGSYELTLNWFAGSKECKVKILMNGEGSLQFLERNGVTEEELKEHKEVKVGRQYETKFLHEALV